MDLQWDDAGSEARFSAYVETLSKCLGHRDRVAPFRSYCMGLLLPGDRKSVEPIAARLRPDRTAAEHQALLHFVGQSPWDSDALLRAVRHAVLPAMTQRTPVEAWIVDDTSFPKKECHSVGVARQYSGQLGDGAPRWQVAKRFGVLESCAASGRRGRDHPRFRDILGHCLSYPGGFCTPRPGVHIAHPQSPKVAVTLRAGPGLRRTCPSCKLGRHPICRGVCSPRRSSFGWPHAGRLHRRELSLRRDPRSAIKNPSWASLTPLFDDETAGGLGLTIVVAGASIAILAGASCCFVDWSGRRELHLASPLPARPGSDLQDLSRRTGGFY